MSCNEYLLVDDSCNGHCVKGLVGGFPHLLTECLTKLLKTLTEGGGGRDGGGRKGDKRERRKEGGKAW